MPFFACKDVPPIKAICSANRSRRINCCRCFGSICPNRPPSQPDALWDVGSAPLRHMIHEGSSRHPPVRVFLMKRISHATILREEKGGIRRAAWYGDSTMPQHAALPAKAERGHRYRAEPHRLQRDCSPTRRRLQNPRCQRLQGEHLRLSLQWQGCSCPLTQETFDCLACRE